MNSDLVSGFLFYLLFVSPALGWILKPGRFKRKVGIRYAILFLSAIGLLSVGLEFKESGHNFYHLLDVPIDASLSELKRAYRTQSVAYHPDKNPSPSAAEEFNRIRIAFEVLADADKRRKYNIYGEDEVVGESATTSVDDEKSLFDRLIQLLTHYLVWMVVSYYMTLGSSGDSRSWIYCGFLLCFVLDMNITFGRVDPSATLKSIPGLTQITPHEIIQVLRGLMPVYMNGCRSIGGYLHSDLNRENFAISIEILRSNAFVLMKIKELKVEVEGLAHHTNNAGTTTATLKTADKAPGDNIPPTLRKRRGKTEKTIENKDGDDADKKDDDADDLLKPSPEIQAPPKSPIPSFVWGLAVYAAIYYISS